MVSLIIMPQFLRILYEDAAILAAAKLEPMPIQPDTSGDPSLQSSLKAYLRNRDGRDVFLEAAHRIDRRTSGVVLFGKSRRAVSALDAAFRARRIHKIYWAVPERPPRTPEGRLVHRLARTSRGNRTLAIPLSTDAETWNTGYGTPVSTSAAIPSDLAILDYRTIGHSERYTLLEIQPLTGKTHQIRAQLAAIDSPLRGDLKYGARRSCRNGLIMLHARSVSFQHPATGENMVITAPLPGGEPLWLGFPELEGCVQESDEP